ncbi:MAG TPA: inner membrane-spanning protein YciB [Rhizomicrobium sp.]
MNPQLRRLLLDLGPLVVFFATVRLFGLITATGVFMVLVAAALVAGYVLEKRISPIALFSAAVVLVFGGLTLYLQNGVFVKIKPTFTYGVFCAVLLGGLAFNRLFIKYALSFEFEMPDSTWRTLTWRFGIFFGCLALFNEFAWRNLSDANWALSKIAALIVTFLFAMAQTPILLKHMPQEKSGE